jgi:hypothetical protein
MTVNQLLLDALGPYLRQAMDTSAAGASVAFRHAIRSIYGAKENGRPMHIGSSILLVLDGVHYVVTAAHVIDHSDETTLYIGADADLVPLIGLTFSTTQAPSKRRDLDRHDFAFAALTDAIIEKLAGAKFIEEDEIDATTPDGRGDYYTVLGFPNSRNGDFDNALKRATAKIWPYSGTAAQHQKLLEQLPDKGANHILIKFEGWGANDQGVRVRNLSPRGMSGGAVVRGQNLADPKAVFLGAVTAPKLAGVVIERDQKYPYLIATHMSAVLSAIRESGAKDLYDPIAVEAGPRSSPD